MSLPQNKSAAPPSPATNGTNGTLRQPNAASNLPTQSPVSTSAPAKATGWHQPTLTSLYTELSTTPQGLSTEEAQKRLTQNGPNEPAPAHQTSILVQILRLFANPLVGILLFASVVSAIVGDPINASIIMIIVLLSVFFNFYQSFKSQQAAEKLRAQVAPTATALRDTQWKEVPRRELVTGDIIRLSAGDLVPADARIIDERDLHIQQAALTGESLPVEKAALEVDTDAKSTLDARNAVFLGTSVVSGSATALVQFTGSKTQFGDIATRLSTRPPETEFERGTKQFGFLIMRTVFFLVLFVFVVTVIGHKSTALEALLFAVALAVGLTPEFLPMITTVTLSQAAVHMSRRKVIVKDLAAIQNFGSIDILCSDKTGTITSGEMALDHHLDPTGKPADKVLLLAYLNSSFQTGMKNPLDEAIMKNGAMDISAYTKLDEIPFDFERRLLSVVVASNAQAGTPTATPNASQTRIMITKGAPESVLKVCTSYEVDGKVYPLDSAASQECNATYQSLSTSGFRVLGVAYKNVDTQPAYRKADEHDLTLIGYLTFLDRPLPDAAASIENMRRDGVLVKILTGDNELVAGHVCAQVGLGGGRIVLGDEIDAMTDVALAQVAEQNNVFARVSPAQKHRIILALKTRGHVVGYIGDGINDAPSLHAADVGISVAGAVDVAKDAADIILMESGLDVLHNGILEGRKAFGNVMKYLLMGTSSNFGNMFSMAIASVFLPYLPMLPTQILLNSFMYDLAQVTIPTDNVDPEFIVKPRRWDISIIRDFMVFIGPISSIYDFLTFAALIWLFKAPESLFQTGWFVESLATQTLVLFVIRTVGNPLRSRPSLPLTVTTLFIVLLGIALPFSPLASFLGFVPLPLGYFLFLAILTVTYLIVVQFAKLRIMKRWLGI